MELRAMSSSIRGDVTADLKLPGMVLVYLMVFLLPIEFSFDILGVFITPTRLLFVIVVIPLICRLLQQGRLHVIDWILIGYVSWVMLAYLIKRGMGGIEPAGEAFLVTFAPYLVARLSFRDPRQVVRFLKVMGTLIFVLGLLAIPESVLQMRYLHDIPRMLTGIDYQMQNDARLGLLRAASTFENPILFGLYSASFLSLVWYSTFRIDIRIYLSVGIFLSTFLSLSSAAILVLVLQLALIILERITRGVRLRGPIIVGLALAGLLAVELGSSRGSIRLIGSYLTFNPHTAYYRLLQWEHSIDDVQANPLFGIRFENWTKPFWMTDSIDNHWLFTAMDSGLPAVVFIFAGLGLLSFGLYQRRHRISDPLLKSLMLGWIIGMLALFLGAWTVTLFGKMRPALFFLIGLGAALRYMTERDVGNVPHEVPEQNRKLRYSRFTSTPGRRGAFPSAAKSALQFNSEPVPRSSP